MFVIVVGGGNTGSQLAKLLLEAGHTVHVIDERPIILEKLAMEVPQEVIVHGDGSSPAVLEKAGIQKAQVLAAVTGSDETNLVVTSLGKFEFNVPRVIARINNSKNAWLFTPEMGVDVSLNQAEILAKLTVVLFSGGKDFPRRSSCGDCCQRFESSSELHHLWNYSSWRDHHSTRGHRIGRRR